MTELNEQQCKCSDCVCIVTVENAIKVDEHLYCSKACSNGHVDGQGCCGDCTCTGGTTH